MSHNVHLSMLEKKSVTEVIMNIPATSTFSRISPRNHFQKVPKWPLYRVILLESRFNLTALTAPFLQTSDFEVNV